MKTLTVKLSEHLEAKLKSYAGKMGWNRSKVVRQALVQYLNMNKTKLRASFLDLSEDLAGSVDAAKDLSFKKKYFEGYGK